jgi:hypothetical protein
MKNTYKIVECYKSGIVFYYIAVKFWWFPLCFFRINLEDTYSFVMIQYKTFDMAEQVLEDYIKRKKRKVIKKYKSDY